MYTSVRWLNDHLDPPASAEEVAELATRAGFPLEGFEEVAVSDGTDIRQDFEMTSNRGDCVSHVGLAREICAISGRRLAVSAPEPPRVATPASDFISVENEETTRCPLYTARIIRGVTIGPSPAWLADRLLARGDIPRNNVVDATNFVLFELGQPTHVFDLATLNGGRIVVRMARPDEPFLPIGEGESEVKLSGEDLVIADAERAVAIAGVKGGAVTAVSEGTTDLVLEAASFDPVSVRNSSRRLGISSDSSYRFERGVHPGQVDAAAERLAALILEIAGGELMTGSVSVGAPIPARKRASMRPERCRQILGVPVEDEMMMDALQRLGFDPKRAGDRIECEVPIHRLDVDREIDLIEEVGRMYGHDKIPVAESIEVNVAPPQPTELARTAIATELVGMGFVETTTHSLIAAAAATLFLPDNASLLRVDDDRARAEAVLQPSIVPNLLRVRRHNRDNGVDHLRLFESAATFWNTEDGHRERVAHALLMDVESEADGLRPIRGVIERLVEVMVGSAADLVVAPTEGTRWLSPGATIRRNDALIGVFGLLASDTAAHFDLDDPLLVAELDLRQFYDAYPPESEAHALPSFPAIDRDLSPILDEAVPWTRITALIDGLALEQLESCRFITTYRGRGLETGQKALTFRLCFRAADRTLTHEEVDQQMERVLAAVQTSLGATFRK